MFSVHTSHINAFSYSKQDANVLAITDTKTHHYRMKIGELITKLAADRGLSDNEISRRTGNKVPQPTVSRVMNGESRSPRRSTLEPIAIALGMTYLELIQMQEVSEATPIKRSQEPEPHAQNPSADSPASGQAGGEIGDSAPKPKPGEEGYIVSAKYNEAPESVKNTIDDLLSLPADQAEEIAATIQKLKGIYGSGGKA